MKHFTTQLAVEALLASPPEGWHIEPTPARAVYEYARLRHSSGDLALFYRDERGRFTASRSAKELLQGAPAHD